MGQKYWHKLLTQWRRDGRDGFTIPYIIGSQKYLPASHVNQNIDQLVIDIVSNREDEIYIKYCITTQDIILGIRDETKINIPGVFPPFNGTPQSKLFLTSFLTDLGNNVETIILKLKDRYDGYIDSEKVSINDRIRGYYLEEEINFIKSCYSGTFDYFKY